jgi:ligand-binding sensor domain-containing protein
MHQLPDGRMLLTGPSLLAIGRPGSFQMATRANGLPGINDAIVARDGTIWLATPDGLYRFPSPFRMEYWTIREGVLDPPWALTRVGSRMYVGLEGRIAALNQDRARWNILANFKDGGTVSSLLPAESGNLFAGFMKGEPAELRTDGTVIARMKASEGLGERLARTPDGQVWLGGSYLGVVSRQQNTLKLDRHPLLTKPSRNVLAIKYEDRTRRLWACYNGGLILRDDQGVWREFTTKDGLRVNGCWSLAPLPNGDVWYAYFGYVGTALIHPSADGRIRVRNYGRGNMPDPGGDTLDLDHNARLWRGGELGIHVADPAEAEAANWLQLDRSDGLPANGMNSGSVFVDTDGSLWWGADNDLAHYVPPADLVTPAFAPQVFVSALSWEGQAPKFAQMVQGVPHGAHCCTYRIDAI